MNDVTNTFSINRENALITLMVKPLLQQYKLKVMASDQGRPRKSSSVNVIINVQGVSAPDNNFSPIFSKKSYSFKLSENVQQGTNVGTVMAMDFDPVSFITYSLESDKPFLPFNVSTYGVIRTVSTIDREATEEYKFDVIASDGYGKSTTASVTVSIWDLNDNKPMMDQSLYKFEVKENTKGAVRVAHITVTDADVGANGAISRVDIINRDCTMFRAERNNMLVTVWLDTPVDYESMKNITCNIEVIDHGLPRLYNTAELQVSFINENDNIPHFYQELAMIIIREDISRSQVVFTATASDKDGNGKFKICYDLVFNISLKQIKS